MRLKELSNNSLLRSLIRRITENKWWLSRIETNIKKRGSLKKTGESVLDFGGINLTLDDMLVLMSPNSERELDDFKYIAQKISAMSPFAQYSLRDTQELIQRGSLRGYRRGLELFHTGDKPLSAYFILSGKVHVTPMEREGAVESPKSSVKGRKPSADMAASGGIQILNHGNMLGLEEILIGFKRKATAIVAEDLLCIRFEKKYILVTLKPMLDTWIEISKYLLKFNIFNYTLPNVMYDLCKIGTIKRYRPGRQINIYNSTYFLVEGEVSVIQRLVVEKHSQNGKENYKLHHNQDAIISPMDNLEQIFMQVCVLTKGAFFGLGDRLSMNVVWTIKPCKFVKFKRDVLTKFEKTLVWEGGRMFINILYPTIEEVFQHFLYNRRWWRYKKEVLDQCKKTNLTATIKDVPIPIRFTNLKKCSMKKLRMEQMSEYLCGRMSPLDGESLKSTLLLDEFGEMRDTLLGQYKTEPRQEF